jgi:phage terminase Nu1 subunit (DNA packaging protein)
VIQRQGDGFPLDRSRVAYLRFLRRERQQSPRSEADADFQRAKAELIRLRIEEKQRALVRRADADALIDQIAGTVLTHLSGMSARCSRDIVVRRNIDAVVVQIRREIGEACNKAADDAKEPPLDEQD